MSADEWYECEVCEKNKKAKLEEAYGKVSKKEYEELEKELEDDEEYYGRPLPLYSEIYFSDGKMVVDAYAECRVCGTTWRLNEEVDPK